jgi:hypothetical protein
MQRHCLINGLLQTQHLDLSRLNLALLLANAIAVGLSSEPLGVQTPDAGLNSTQFAQQQREPSPRDLFRPAPRLPEP